jgi:hypothetical protein
VGLRNVNVLEGSGGSGGGGGTAIVGDVMAIIRRLFGDKSLISFLFLSSLCPSGTMSLQDTNIIKCVISSSAAKRNGILTPIMTATTMSDKRKWEEFISIVNEIGPADSKTVVALPEVREYVKYIQDEVEAKKPRIRQIQDEEAGYMKPILNDDLSLMVAAAIKKTNGLKKDAKKAKKDEALALHIEKVKTLMESDATVDIKMLRYAGLMAGLKADSYSETSDE